MLALEKAHEQVMACGDIGAAHHHTGKQPRDLVGNEIDQHVDAFGARQRRGRLVQRSGLDFSGLHRPQPARAAAIFLDGDVIARESELLQRERHRRIAFRAERADADDTALELGRVLTPGAEKNVKRMTFDSEPMTRRSPPA